MSSISGASSSNWDTTELPFGFDAQVIRDKLTCLGFVSYSRTISRRSQRKVLVACKSVRPSRIKGQNSEDNEHADSSIRGTCRPDHHIGSDAGLRPVGK